MTDGVTDSTTLTKVSTPLKAEDVVFSLLDLLNEAGNLSMSQFATIADMATELKSMALSARNLTEQLHRYIAKTDSLFSKSGTWFFYDEAGFSEFGPYPSRERAHNAQQAYFTYLDTGNRVGF